MLSGPLVCPISGCTSTIHEWPFGILTMVMVIVIMIVIGTVIVIVTSTVTLQ